MLAGQGNRKPFDDALAERGRVAADEHVLLDGLALGNRVCHWGLGRSLAPQPLEPGPKRFNLASRGLVEQRIPRVLRHGKGTTQRTRPFIHRA